VIRLLAPLAILLAPFAFALEEVPVAPITFGDAAIMASTRPAMASDGENYLAVWSDDREGVPAVYGARIVILYTHGSRLYAAVMTRTGTIVARDLFVENVDWSDPFASITEAGGGFVAAFTRSVPHAVVVVRFDADGNRVGSTASVAANALHPQIVNESGALRLFSIEGGVVSRTLTMELVAGEPVTVLKTPIGIFTAMGSYAAAAGPRGSLAVGEIYFQAEPEIDRWLYAVDGDAPSDAKLVTRAGTAQYAPAIANGDDGTLVTWEEPASHVLRGKQGGVVFDIASYGRQSAVAAQGGTYLAVWSGGGAMARLVRGGAPLGDAFTLDADGTLPVVASDGRDFIVAWIATAANELRLARVDTTGTVVDRGVVPIQRMNSVVAPALACDRGECLVAWGNEVAHAVRIDASLAVIDQDTIALGDTTNPVAIATAAHDGRYAIAWQHGESIEFHTIDRDGVASPAFTAAGRAPALAAQGDAWVLLREAGEELIVTRFNDRFAGDYALTRDAQARRAPSLAASGANVIVAYERTTRGEEAGGSPRVYVATLEPPKPKRRAARP
jgi:hypothetical protein